MDNLKYDWLMVVSLEGRCLRLLSCDIMLRGSFAKYIA